MKKISMDFKVTLPRRPDCTSILTLIFKDDDFSHRILLIPYGSRNFNFMNGLTRLLPNFIGNTNH
jgi:hypothetical protein